MDKQVIKTDGAPAPVANYSQGIRVGNTLYVQGMIALDPETNKVVEGDVTVQAERVFKSIKAVLDQADAGFENVVKVVAYLADIKDYPDFNKIYNRVFDTPVPPVRTTVQAGLPLGALVEVDVTAVV